MYRVRRKGKPWRTRWPFKKWWPQKVDERFCRECNQPYINGPHPKEVCQFFTNNVAAVLYPAGDWKRERFVVRLGRWKPGSGRFYLSEYVPADELEDAETVIAQVREYIDEFAHSTQPRRKAHRNGRNGVSVVQNRGSRG
jgi:hypothetical protein